MSGVSDVHILPSKLNLSLPTIALPDTSGKEYDLPSSGLPTSHEIHSFYPRDDGHSRYQAVAVKDTKTIGSAYDQYLQNVQITPFSSGEASGLSIGLGKVAGNAMTGLPILDSGITGCPQARGPDVASNGRDIVFHSQPLVDKIARPVRETVPLPPDASSTLYVEGFPPDCTKREVAHIFRPFVGYKEVRIVSKESRHRSGGPIILCFVDFENPACAATAMSALQGYKMDEHDRESNYYSFLGTLVQDLAMEVVERGEA